MFNWREEHLFRFAMALLASAGLVALALPAAGQVVPKTPDHVARPGGNLPGNPKIALVKLADGFNDPVGVASAFDGTGRLFVVERVGRDPSRDRQAARFCRSRFST